MPNCYAPYFGSPRVLSWLAIFGFACLPLRTGAEPPGGASVVRLGEGQAVWASKALSPEQGTLLAWVKGRDWAPAKLQSYAIFEVGVKGYRWALDAAGLTIAVGELNERLDLPELSPSLEHLIAVRWQDGRVEIWLDVRPVGHVEGVRLLGFPGELRCADPTKSKAPYQVLSVFPFQAALSDAEMAAAFHLFGFSNAPFVTIPPTDQAPTLDGVLARGEWDFAASLAGMHRSRDRFVSDSPSQVRAMYDADHLYVCYSTALPPRLEARLAEVNPVLFLRQRAAEPDADLSMDDSFELTVVPRYPAGAWYRLAANSQGLQQDLRGEPGSPPDLSWNPEWESAAGISGSVWVVEMKAPLKAFGAPEPTPGQTEWGANFRRRWRQLVNQDDEWATGLQVRGLGISFSPGPSSPGPLGKIRFGDRTDLIAQLKEARGFDLGRPRFELEIRNPGPSARQARIRLESNCGSVSKTQTLEVPGGRAVPFVFEGGQLKPHSLWVDLRIDEPKRSRSIYRSSFFFHQKTGPECTLRHYPSFETVELTWDLSLYRELPLRDLVVEVQVADRKSGQVVLKQGLTGLENYYPRLRLSTKKLPPGQYVVVTRVGHGEEVGRVLSAFEKRPVPPWRAQPLGTEDRTPAPFTPLEAEGFHGLGGRKINVVGRSYEFGLSALPDQIKVNGEPILAGPIALVCERPEKWTRDLARDIVRGLGAGNPLVLQPHEIRKTRVGWVSESSSATKVKPGISGWAEYDGLLWFTVRVVGVDWQRLKSLQLRIPIKNEWAERIECAIGGTRSSGRQMPADGLETGFGPVWIGKGDVGLQWFAESDASWRLNDPARAIQVLRHENTVLVINFIDHEVKLAGGFSCEFGLLATPVRPPEQTGEGPRPREGPPAPVPDRPAPTRDDLGQESNPLDLLRALPAREPGSADPLVRHVHLSYCHTDNSPLGQEMRKVLEAYFHEWTPPQSDEWRTGLKGMDCCPASRSWQDLLAWLIVTSDRKQPFDILSLHGVRPVYSDNRYAGGGLLHGDAVYPKWSILGTRALLKRIYMALEREDAKARILLHLEGPRLAPFEGFAHRVISSRPESR